jgi:hypothetical protein
MGVSGRGTDPFGTKGAGTTLPRPSRNSALDTRWGGVLDRGSPTPKGGGGLLSSRLRLMTGARPKIRGASAGSAMIVRPVKAPRVHAAGSFAICRQGHPSPIVAESTGTTVRRYGQDSAPRRDALCPGKGNLESHIWHRGATSTVKPFTGTVRVIAAPDWPNRNLGTPYRAPRWYLEQTMPRDQCRPLGGRLVFPRSARAIAQLETGVAVEFGVEPFRLEAWSNGTHDLQSPQSLGRCGRRRDPNPRSGLLAGRCRAVGSTPLEAVGDPRPSIRDPGLTIAPVTLPTLDRIDNEVGTNGRWPDGYPIRTRKAAEEPCPA